MRSTSPKSSADASSTSNGSSQHRAAEASRESVASLHTSSIAPAPTPTSSSTSNITTSTAEKAASQDAEDFFARAKAMGLNLTRQDYERARAGVSAFLKAQRVEKSDATSPALGEVGWGTAGAGSSSSSSSSNTNIINNSSSACAPESSSIHAERSPAIGLQSSGSSKIPSQSKLTSRSTSSPMLSFFTAIIPSEQDDAKSRPSLDDVGALEEKKRKRERKRRLREKREREGNVDTRGEEGFPSRHVKNLSLSSTNLDGSPLTSLGTGTPHARSASSLPPSNQSGKITLLSNDSYQGHVGLGLQMEEGTHTEDEVEDALQIRRQSFNANLQSPVQLFNKTQSVCESPGLRKLSQKAHVDSEGRLTLLATPGQPIEDMHLNISPDVAEEEELVALTNTGAETDDSGVFFAVEPSKKEWGRHRRDTSSDPSPLVDLHESLDRLSFLDRIMAQKKSPIRLRKEARAREREARNLKGSNDLVVMTVTTAPPSNPPHSALQPSSRSNDKAQENRLEVHQSKNVRWAHDSSSPRQRMTTKEHYDFAFYGIAPNPETAANIPTFYDEEVKKSGTDGVGEEQPFHVRQRTTSVWMKNHLANNNTGSPIAARSSTMGPQDSPGVLSLNLESMGDRLEMLSGPHLSARRGLLFGPSSMDRTPPAMSNIEQMDGGHLFSQGPTLARSPARNVFDSYIASTPPKLTRANTLAAPFSFNQASTDEEKSRGGVEESPDRVMLMRAHSSGALERRRPSHSRQASLLAKEIGKENMPLDNSTRVKKVPAGWAHRSPMGKYDTISPAAIFGMSSVPQRIRVLSGEIQEMGRLPLEPIKVQKRSKIDEVNSDEEGDDERELDFSPGLNSSGAGRQFQVSPSKSLMRKDRNHARDSSASTSVFEDSPLYLDVHNRTASIVSALPSSSSTLARAVGMNEEEANASTKTKKKKQRTQEQQQQQLGQSPGEVCIQKDKSLVDQVSLSQQSSYSLPSSTSGMLAQGRMEWDKPDGSRVVKLISEELQAALESGALTAEPPARYYKLPAEWGRSKAKPQSVSYAGMIGQAILSSSDGRLSLNEVYNWISTVFPFFERGDRGWQNSIRHNLSLNKSFIKVEREANVPGKGGWWAIKQGHEDRFRGGSYIAPGSALSQKVGPKTPKMSHSNVSTEDGPDQWTAPMQEDTIEDNATAIRRKRQESDRSEGVSEHPSDSDYNPTGQPIKTSKKVKKVKLVGGMAKKGRSPYISPASIDGKTPNVVSIQSRVPLRPVQSSSPRDAPFDTITPSRPHHYTASSGHGSTSTTTTMMANMPMLTDASSPPSSPNNFDALMPPPSGGIQGAASSQSARKRKQAVNRAVDLMNGTLSMNSINQQSGFTGHTPSFASNLGSYNHLSSHALQASPLAHMRGNSGNANGSTLNNNARLRAGPGHSLIGAMDSPLRRLSNGQGSPIDNSPSRLYINSPISSLRGSTGNHESTISMERSTTGEVGGSFDEDAGGLSKSVNTSSAMASPMKGSPQRGSSQFAPHSQSSQLFLSPAGMHLQMALGQGTQSSAGTTTQANGSSQFLNFTAGNTPNRYMDQNNGNFLYQQRWGASPSPNKMMRFPVGNGNLYPSNGTPTHGQGSGSNNLDDPFDYSGTLQHELEMSAELSQFDIGESPMKMAYPQIVRNQFFNGQGQSLQQQQLHQQQQLQQLQQQQQQLHYSSNGSYSNNGFGGPNN